MNKRMHLIMAASYVGAGLVAMLLLTMRAGLIGVLIGLVVIVGGGLVHEFMTRRDSFQKAARGLVGLRGIADKATTDINTMKQELGKAGNDARGANAAAIQAQQEANAAAQQLKVLLDEWNSAKEALAPLPQSAQQAAEDIAQIQDAGNQLYEQFQAMQEHQVALVQQIEHLQATVAALSQGGGRSAVTPPPPPPAPPPPSAPRAAQPPSPPPAGRAEPKPSAPPKAAAPVKAPAAEGLAGTVLGVLADRAAIANTGSEADTSLLAIVEGLMADNIDLYAEPIVTLPERKLAHYECYGGVRAPDGGVLGLDQSLDLSGRDELMGAIENALMTRCLDRLAGIDLSGSNDGGCFYNVAGSTLGDRGFFASLIEYLGAHRDIAGKLILEFTQDVLMEHGESAVEDLVRLQDLGVRFSIDEVNDLEIDFESLVGFGFRFVKVGSKFIRVQANAADDPETVRGLAKSLEALGIATVVENVETDLSLVELIGFDIGLGQGPLFGQPSVVGG